MALNCYKFIYEKNQETIEENLIVNSNDITFEVIEPVVGRSEIVEYQIKLNGSILFQAKVAIYIMHLQEFNDSFLGVVPPNPDPIIQWFTENEGSYHGGKLRDISDNRFKTSGDIKPGRKGDYILVIVNDHAAPVDYEITIEYTINHLMNKIANGFINVFNASLVLILAIFTVIKGIKDVQDDDSENNSSNKEKNTNDKSNVEME